MHRPGSAHGFTLVELLVVITIIVILLALLAPALDRAVYNAETAKCLASQRTIVQAAQSYAVDHKRVLPPWKIGTRTSSAFDLRGPWNARPRAPMGIGLLPEHGYLPGAQLGKVIHCPPMDNSGAGGFKGLGMDVKWAYDPIAEGAQGAGGSWWTDPDWTNDRIVASFNYRSISYELAGKGMLKLSNAGSGIILSIDMLDVRFGGKYLHPEGYNRVFGDGGGSFFFDPLREVDELIKGYVHVGGGFGGIKPLEEESIYEHLATQK